MQLADLKKMKYEFFQTVICWCLNMKKIPQTYGKNEFTLIRIICTCGFQWFLIFHGAKNKFISFATKPKNDCMIHYEYKQMNRKLWMHKKASKRREKKNTKLQLIELLFFCVIIDHCVQRQPVQVLFLSFCVTIKKKLLLFLCLHLS